MKTILFFVLLCINGLNAKSLEDKYPSYSYVFNEFDVDESYLYDEEFVQFVLKNEKQLKKFYRRSLKRGKDILHTMQELLVNDELSDLFIYLSMIESGFSPNIVSPKKAVGLWQFMPATAKHYKLKVCKEYDERCDTVFSTSAAINYLKKLHRQFGKWYLAAMAYNCGEGCIERAIKRAGTDDLSVLVNNNTKYLPKETRNYIRKILLIAMIGEKSILDFGFVSNSDTLIQVEVRGGTSLTKLAKLLKIEPSSLLALNSGIRDGLLPKKEKNYKIIIPIEKMYAFYLWYDFETEEPKVVKSHMISHTIRLGETLEDIARLYQVQKDEIERINHIVDNFLVVDRVLVIPLTKSIFEKVSK